MKIKTRKAIDEILEIKDSYYPELEDKISKFIIAIENLPKPTGNMLTDLQKQNEIKSLANSVKNFMITYCDNINGAVDDIFDSVKIKDL